MHFGINFLMDRPVIQLDLKACGTYVVPIIDEAPLLDLLAIKKYVADRTQRMISGKMNIPPFSESDIAEIMFLSNRFTLPEWCGAIHYLGTDDEPSFETLRSHLQGGLGHKLFLKWDIHQVSLGIPNVVNAWKMFGENYAVQGSISIDSGMFFSHLFAVAQSTIKPDIVLRDSTVRSRDVGGIKTYEIVDFAAVSEEVDTSHDSALHSVKRETDVLRHLCRNLAGITLTCHPEVEAQRELVYRGMNFNVLHDSDFARDVIVYLNGGTTTSGKIKVKPLSGGGIEGVARVDDGSQAMGIRPTHVIFEIRPAPAWFMASLRSQGLVLGAYLVTARIGEFEGYVNLPEGEAPDVGAARLVPGKTWYDSAHVGEPSAAHPTFLVIRALLDNMNVPFHVNPTSYMASEATDLATHISKRLDAIGQIIEGNDWRYIREHDPYIYNEIVARIMPGIAHTGVKGSTAIKEGRVTLRTEFDVLTRFGAAIIPATRADYCISDLKDNTDILNTGFVLQAINCPPLKSGDPAHIQIYAPPGTGAAVQKLIDDDFADATPKARILVDAIFGDKFWEHLGTSTWNKAKDYDHAERTIKKYLDAFRLVIKNAKDFTLDHPAVQAYLALLRGIKDGDKFPTSTDLRNKSKQIKDLVDGWFTMWAGLFQGHDQPTGTFIGREDRTAKDKQRLIEGILARAIIFDWPAGAAGTQQRALDILWRHYAQAPPWAQLHLLAMDSAFTIIDGRPLADASGKVVIGGWQYARAQSVLPGGSIVQYMLRYKPNGNLILAWGSDLQAYAVGVKRTGPGTYYDYSPTPTGTAVPMGDAVDELHAIITGAASLPTGYGSLTTYLDSLSHVTIRPGALKPGDPDFKPYVLPDLSWLLP
nr:hypothetical protein [Candidatus Sigynarchaeota archaeon]